MHKTGHNINCSNRNKRGNSSMPAMQSRITPNLLVNAPLLQSRTASFMRTGTQFRRPQPNLGYRQLCPHRRTKPGRDLFMRMEPRILQSHQPIHSPAQDRQCQPHRFLDHLDLHSKADPLGRRGPHHLRSLLITAIHMCPEGFQPFRLLQSQLPIPRPLSPQHHILRLL